MTTDTGARCRLRRKRCCTKRAAPRHFSTSRGLIADTVARMEKPIHAHHADQGKPSGDSGAPNAVSVGKQTDELLAKAVGEALAAGMSWAQIGGRLGVPNPAAGQDVVTDQDWQEAIVAHENARVARHNDLEVGRR